MVTERPSVVYIAVTVVNILVLLFALVSLFINYSLVRWLYFMIAFAFFMIGDIYGSIGHTHSAVVIHIVSVLLALNVVFYHFEPLCDKIMIYVHT
jgi:hypothetical protein